MRLQRNGNCFEESVNKIISMRDKRAVLVHGLPMGRGGEAAKAGRYPHSWVELDDEVWEPALDDWISSFVFYALGDIKYTIRYSMTRVRDLMDEHNTFGPWCETLLKRDAEIDQEFGT